MAAKEHVQVVGPRQDVPSGPVGQILTYEGRSIALVDLGREASDALRASWSADRPFESAGVIESAWLQPMLGAGSVAASSLAAGNVFLATANPGTLMTLGTGVGSAVMGTTGIVAQAPFVAASGALIPVVAPLMLFTTVSSVMVCSRLDRAQRTLGRLFEIVDRVSRILGAEDYARFETAAERIDDIRSEYERCGRFPSDVPDRLSSVEHDVRLLRSKYGLLLPEALDSEADAKSVVSDLNRFFLASLYDIQVDVLRLYLALQNDPDVVGPRQSRLEEKIRRYADDFRQVLDSDPVGAYHRKLKGDLAESRWNYFRRGLPRPFRGELAEKVRNVRAIRRDDHSARARIGRWVGLLETVTDESRQQSVVFYRDGEGMLRAYHTGDIRLEQAIA